MTYLCCVVLRVFLCATWHYLELFLLLPCVRVPMRICATWHYFCRVRFRVAVRVCSNTHRQIGRTYKIRCSMCCSKKFKQRPTCIDGCVWVRVPLSLVLFSVLCLVLASVILDSLSFSWNSRQKFKQLLLYQWCDLSACSTPGRPCLNFCALSCFGWGSVRSCVEVFANQIILEVFYLSFVCLFSFRNIRRVLSCGTGRVPRTRRMVLLFCVALYVCS